MNLSETNPRIPRNFDEDFSRPLPPMRCSMSIALHWRASFRSIINDDCVFWRKKLWRRNDLALFLNCPAGPLAISDEESGYWRSGLNFFARMSLLFISGTERSTCLNHPIFFPSTWRSQQGKEEAALSYGWNGPQKVQRSVWTSKASGSLFACLLVCLFAFELVPELMVVEAWPKEGEVQREIHSSNEDNIILSEINKIQGWFEVRAETLTHASTP